VTKLEPYAEYKNSGIEWLGMVPAEWTVIKTGHVTRLTTGWTPPTGDSEAYVGDNLWANISDLGPKILKDTSKRISDEAVTSARIARSRKGSLLFSFKLSVGQVSFAGTDMYTNEAIATFEETDRLSTRFAYYALPLYLLQNANENIYGAKLLNQDLMKSARLCLPAKTIQDRIADYLDRETAQIDELIGKQEGLIDLLAEKRQAIITHAITKGLNAADTKPSSLPWLGEVAAHWTLVKLKHVVDVLTGFPFKSEDFTEDLEDIALLRGVNVNPGQTNWGDTVRFSRLAADEYSTYLLRKGDLVLGLDRPIVSDGIRVCSIEERDLPALLLQRVARIRANNKANQEFIGHVLSSSVFASYLEPLFTGVSVPHMSPGQLGEFKIALPPLQEQEVILRSLRRSLSKLDVLADRSRSTIGLLRERRSALISAAVTGKIKVTEDDGR